MPQEKRREIDADASRFEDALRRHQNQHPQAKIKAKRQNSVSIRGRILDPDFKGISRAERHDIVWRFIEELPEEIQSQVTMLILLTPEEAKSSLANLEFENPIPSNL